MPLVFLHCLAPAAGRRFGCCASLCETSLAATAFRAVACTRGVVLSMLVENQHVVTATVKCGYLPAGITSDPSASVTVRQDCTGCQQDSRGLAQTDINAVRAAPSPAN